MSGEAGRDGEHQLALTGLWATPCRHIQLEHLYKLSMDLCHRNAACDVYRNRKQGELLGLLSIITKVS